MARRRRPPPRVLRHLQPCPDCAALWEGTDLVHEPSCPIANGIDDICDEDRQWFIDNPGEWTRTRPITWAEYQTMLGNLQANILRAHGRNFARHIFVRFSDQSAAVKKWITPERT